MKHEECMKNDAEYKKVYDIFKENDLHLQKVLEVVVKSNGLVGVGIVSFKQGVDAQLDKLMKGY